MYRLLINPDLLGNNPVIDAFYYNVNNQSIKDFAENELNINQARRLSATGASTLTSNLINLTNLISEWKDLISLYQSSNDTLWVNSLRAAKQASMLTILSSTLNILGQEISDNVVQIDEIIPINSSLGSNLTFKTNEVEVNDIYLKTIARGINSFTTAQLTMLYNIASQCPNVGGRAVLLARMLYNYHHPTHFDDNIICNSQPIILNNVNSSKENSSFNIFPNPTKELLKIIPLNSSVSNELEVQILDIRMKNVMSKKLTKEGAWEINTSGLNDGLYFISIWDKGIKLFTSKFVKIN